jgi:hypothetical protein
MRKSIQCVMPVTGRKNASLRLGRDHLEGRVGEEKAEHVIVVLQTEPERGNAQKHCECRCDER